jgi:hypothetical protein
MAKSFLDPVVVENGQSDRCFPDATNTYESNGIEVFGKTNNTLDEAIASEAISRRRGRKFSKKARFNVTYRAS